MAHPIVMPKPGQYTEECTVARWLKREGDLVAKGDVLLEIETDKSNMEIESFYEGTLLKIFVQEGETVPVQTTLAFIGTPGEPLPAVQPPPATPKPTEVTPRAPAAAPHPSPTSPSAAPAPAGPAPTPVAVAVDEAPPPALRISPRARALAREFVIDPSPIRGTGPNGRILERDVRAYLDERGYHDLRISPAAKALAAKEKLDLLSITPTREQNRMTVADVQRAMAERPRPLSRKRQVIAQRLTRSFTTTPHFSVTIAVDLTDLLTLRASWKKQGISYTVTDFITHATAQSLIEYPEVNSSTDGTTSQWHAAVHLGLAVDLPDGLVVAVVRDAQSLSLAELHTALAGVVEKARAGRLGPTEMTGSTFTISNLGMLDVENFTAIINPGESAILAVASARPQPVVHNGEVAIRSIMRLTLSADHRMLDGAQAARFLHAIRTRLEDTTRWTSMIS